MASLAILVLVIGMGSNVLFHAAEAKTVSKHSRFPIYNHRAAYESAKFSPAGNMVTHESVKLSLDVTKKAHK